MTSLYGLTHPPIGFGPGSQPEADEEGLEYLPMPSGMRVYHPHLPDIADPARAAAARGLLERLHAALAGVWRVRSYEAGSAAPRETVLVGAFPRVALTRAFPAAPAEPPTEPPAGLMNGQPILTELLDHSARWRRGDAAHAVNFSLLPHSPEDLAFVERRLGVGATTILSRGYGNCRVTATATPNVWWVRYYNSMDTLILNTVEVTQVPAVVCAAAEDIADSAERLAEILDAIGGPAVTGPGFEGAPA